MAKKRAPVVVEPDDFELEEPQQLIEDGLTDNARDVPMFADIDGRTSRSISFLRLSKLEPGGPAAYKGMIPLNSTLDSIGQVYGDGIYTIEGLNHKHTVLATKDNIRISLSTAAQASSSEQRQLALPGVGDADRVERLALRAAEESKLLNQSFTSLVVEQTRASAEREREFYAASRERDAQMFTSLMAMQNAAFQQTITMMQNSHNQTLESLNVTARIRRTEDKDSSQMVDVLLRGLQMGRELTDGSGQDERPAWEQILTSGLGLLGTAKQLEASGVPTPTPAPAPVQPAPQRLSPSAKRELRDALKLLREVRAKGIDPKELLVRLSEVGNPEPTDGELDDDSEHDDSDTDQVTEDEAQEPSHYSA